MAENRPSGSSRIMGGIVAGIGFLLSPLSWWNDLLVNIPLSYGFAVLINFVIPHHFSMFMILGYWLTNVLGLVMMHKGGSLAIGDGQSQYTTKAVILDLRTSLIYSLIIALLVILNILKLPTEYFK